MKLFQKFSLIFMLLTINSAIAETLATGNFKQLETSINAAGGFEIVKDSGHFVLRLNESFAIHSGPDLFLVFHPLADSLINNDNTKTNVLKITPGLKSITGQQSYPLPDDFDLKKYASLMVLCWQYNHLFSSASIQVTKPTTQLIHPEQSFQTNQKYLNKNLSVVYGGKGFSITGKEVKLNSFKNSF